MSDSLPDRPRPRLTLPVRSLATGIARVASAAAWRALNPAKRERFLESGRPALASRRVYETADGWRCPLFRLPPAPGGAGEPVVLAHGLGVGPDAFRYGGASVARALQRSGFTVYLLTHRADPESCPPGRTRRGDVSFEDLIEYDLPAALQTAADDSGFSAAHLVGHGLGGLLGLAAAARRPEHLASVIALGAPLRFARPRSEARAAARALHLLPARWRLPLSIAARAGLPWIDDEVLGEIPGPRLRGALAYTVSDPPVGLLRAAQRWLSTGVPDLYGGLVPLEDHLADAQVPLMVISGGQDTLCPPAAAERALRKWGHDDATALRAPGCGHLDLLLGASAVEEVFGPLCRWLRARRRLAWTEARAAG